MAIAIFIAYLIIFCWLIARLHFFTKSGLYKPVLVGLFVCKVAAGVVYAWFYSLPQYVAGSDTWRFFEASKEETHLLLTNPLAFIKDIFSHGYSEAGNIFYGKNTYWNDLKSNVVIKLMAVCNVFTFKNYYANIILFNFLFFFGPVAFYRVMQPVFPGKKALMCFAIFLLPSFLFWCSGIHKDGLIFSALALFVFYTNKLTAQNKLQWGAVIGAALSFVLLFALRNVICLLLLPALLAWILCNRYPKHRAIVVAGVYVFCMGLFFASAYIMPSANLPQYAVEKQNEFKQLQGASQIHVRLLEPTFMSFIKFLPTAVDIALLRPHLAEMRNSSYLPAVVELFLLWFLIGVFLFSKKNYPANSKHTSLVIFCFCFAFSYLLLSGYTVTFSGAIVRYKAIALPFLFCPLICITNLSKEMIIKR